MFDIRIISTAVAGFGLLAASVAIPQAAIGDTADGNATPLVMAQAANFEEETIEAFVTAQLRVEEIRTTYVERLESADTDEERIGISQEANQEMLGAVNETPGITVDEYNAIVEAAATDAELANRLNEELATPPQ